MKQKPVVKPTKKFNVLIHFILDLNEFEILKAGDGNEVKEIVKEMILGQADWPEMEKIEIKTERIVRCEYE